LTKSAFLTAYRAELARFPWANDAAKLDRFMRGVADSITGGPKKWDHTGAAVKSAWQSIGGNGAPTFRALCALPN